MLSREFWTLTLPNTDLSLLWSRETVKRCRISADWWDRASYPICKRRATRRFPYILWGIRWRVLNWLSSAVILASLRKRQRSSVVPSYGAVLEERRWPMATTKPWRWHIKDREISTSCLSCICVLVIRKSFPEWARLPCTVVISFRASRIQSTVEMSRTGSNCWKKLICVRSYTMKPERPR